MAQWLGLCAFTAEGAGSVPGRGTKIPQAAQQAKKKKEKSITGDRKELLHKTSFKFPRTRNLRPGDFRRVFFCSK